MTKELLRQEYRLKRNNITPLEKSKLDDLLLIQFQQKDYSEIHTLLSYWPIEAHAEPNTHLFSRYLHFMLPDLQIAYPVSDHTQLSMSAVAVHDDTVYQTDRRGITEPKEGRVVSPEKIDLIFVPLLICDTKGYRIGYGKGFYDRYLAQCSAHTITMGFSYFDPVEPIADTHSFDVPLHYCITPQNIYEF